MVHSAGSAIFSGLRMEIHRHKLKYILDPRSGRWGRKGRPSPSVPVSGSEKGCDYLSGSQRKSRVFLLNHFPLLLLGSHDTGGSAAGHLTPPACCCGCGSRWRHPGAPLLTVFLLFGWKSPNDQRASVEPGCNVYTQQMYPSTTLLVTSSPPPLLHLFKGAVRMKSRFFWDSFEYLSWMYLLLWWLNFPLRINKAIYLPIYLSIQVTGHG